MPDTPNIQTALASVMAELPAISKDGRADKSQGGYAYRGIEQITKEAQGLFAKYGVVIVPAVQSIAVKDITVNSKPWTDTTLIVNYTLTSRDGSSLQATTVGIGRDNSDKGANKAMSQAFKYLLLQVLCISDAKDDADGSTFEADAHYEEPEHPLADRVRSVMAEIGSLDIDGKALMKEWKGGRSLAGPALLADEGWLLMVESWIDERKATQ